ncbi:MAG: sulfatase-like hydrolase/transferase [Terrimonas sp.]|nr:sulfatase-like hydrolase/transferase [Terrimonas sp.]
MLKLHIYIVAACLFLQNAPLLAQKNSTPNVVIIYSDDVGYGDISCNGATKIQTPHIDRIANMGIRFTNAYATSSTCTPSRYALLTGEYPWRKEGTGIAAGNAGSIIDKDQTTMGDIFQQAGYQTAVIGKWHLGLGGKSGPDWNGSIKPGPQELGFNYSFIIPATPDRVPCVYVENDRVANLDPHDPISVSYSKPILDLPTGKDHPELLTMMYSHGHDQTIINGISRIGYMKGGKSAWWKDEWMADDITEKAIEFIRKNQSQPFFLYYAIQDIHVPRVPNPRYIGKSGMGPRGDALVELDDNTGKILNLLDSLQLTNNTLVIFSSDNGPILDDGYQDQAVEKLNHHMPAGPMRGGKYSKFEGGTHLPFLVCWPAVIPKKQVSNALISQVDLIASFARLLQQDLPSGAAPDSQDMLDVLLGRSEKGRNNLIVQGSGNGLAIIKGNWKYIGPSKGIPLLKEKNMETGNNPLPQLYDLDNDIGETVNLATVYPDMVRELSALLEQVQQRK